MRNLDKVALVFLGKNIFDAGTLAAKQDWKIVKTGFAAENPDGSGFKQMNYWLHINPPASKAENEWKNEDIFRLMTPKNSSIISIVMMPAIPGQEPWVIEDKTIPEGGLEMFMFGH